MPWLPCPALHSTGTARHAVVTSPVFGFCGVDRLGGVRGCVIHFALRLSIAFHFATLDRDWAETDVIRVTGARHQRWVRLHVRLVHRVAKVQGLVHR
jgi:hypothetical protein